MKQKYLLLKSSDKNAFVIQEFAELDKDKFSLLCEETYDAGKLRDAMIQGTSTLVTALRTPNLYPIGEYAEKIADAVTRLYDADDKETLELVFDDMDLLRKSQDEVEEIGNEPEEDSGDLDDVLDENLEDGAADDTMLDKLKPVVKVADEEAADSGGDP